MNNMQVLSFIWGILSILGMLVALIPLLGWLNWGNIPFAVVGLIIGVIAKSRARRMSPLSTIGITLCSIAIVIGAIRLAIGGGIL